MNREIKFRVWDIDNNEWGNPDYLECGDGGKLMYFGHLPNREKFVIQQFTGLKDKNGKEIYEGDILQIRTPYRTFQTHYGKNIPRPDGKYTEYLEPEIKQQIDTVVFRNGMSCLKNNGSFREDENEIWPLYWETINYSLEEIQNRIGPASYGVKWDDPEEGDLKYLLDAYELETEEDLIKYLGIQIVGNVFENPELVNLYE